jgi:hypothetical protein
MALTRSMLKKETKATPVIKSNYELRVRVVTVTHNYNLRPRVKKA